MHACILVMLHSVHACILVMLHSVRACILVMLHSVRACILVMLHSYDSIYADRSEAALKTIETTIMVGGVTGTTYADRTKTKL